MPQDGIYIHLLIFLLISTKDRLLMQNSLINRLKSIFFPSGWCCAVRFNKSSNICILNNIDDEFTVLPDSKRYWTADPFLVKKDGKYYLFFEMFDRFKRKGALGYRELSEKSIGSLNVVYESDTHLSYPFIYEKDGVFYMIPESNKSGELFVLKCTDFPSKWVKEKVIAKENLVDTTLFSYNGVNYYISERVDGTNNFDRVDLFYEENGCFTECVNNPVKLDANTARCAGNFFEYNGNYIRPSQDCGVSYGEKLNFNKVISISKENYEEELITTISHKDINLDKKGSYIGIHTYNKVDHVEVVDLKTDNKFSFCNLIGIVYKLFAKVKGKLK